MRLPERNISDIQKFLVATGCVFRRLLQTKEKVPRNDVRLYYRQNGGEK